MFTVRSEQMEAMEAYARSGFHNEMVAHLQEFAPELCGVAGADGLRELVVTGLKRAGDKYGFATRGALKMYLELMLLFGSDFDSDPQYPWARELLTSTDAGDELTRSGTLYRRACEYLDAAGGLQMRHAAAALGRAAASELQDFLVGAESPLDAILHHLRAVYPQKFDYVGEPALRDMLREAGEEARRFQVASKDGLILIAGLMYAFGHGVLKDPMYPWAAKSLDPAGGLRPAERIQVTVAKTRSYLLAAASNLSTEEGPR